MKVTPQKNRYKGMTLIEITLVIAILLGLITVLFIGITAYKNGADNAKCILQLATTQKLIISYGNLNGLSAGAVITYANLITDEYITDVPVCPTGNFAYNTIDEMPNSTTAFSTCVNEDASRHILILLASP